MPDVDFAMTYPCWFLKTSKGNLEVVSIDENRCLSLFTDEYLIEPFYREKYGDNLTTREVKLLRFENQQDLIEWVEDYADELNEQSIHHLAIDFTPGKQTGYVKIPEFIRHLQQQ